MGKIYCFLSTAAVYGEPEEIPITEEHPTNPENTYGESKLFFEKMLKRYDEIHGLKYVSCVILMLLVPIFPAR